MGSPQMHVAKADRRSTDARIERLPQIRLAAETCLEVEVLPDCIDGGPEGGRRQLDDRVPHRVLHLAGHDEVRFASRIFRVVSLVVYVPFPEALHVYAELHVLEELL